MQERGKELMILKDTRIKTNLLKWQPLRALREYEAALAIGMLAKENLRKTVPNITEHQEVTIVDLQFLAKECIIVIKLTDKTGALVALPFDGYDKSSKERLAEKIHHKRRRETKKPKSKK